MYEEKKAEQASNKALEGINDYPDTLKKDDDSIDDTGNSSTDGLPSDTPGSQGGSNISEIEYPDYILNPEMEMPVKEIDGIDYIGTLKIPSFE